MFTYLFDEYFGLFTENEQVKKVMDDDTIIITEITDDNTIIEDKNVIVKPEISEEKLFKTEKVIKQKKEIDDLTDRQDIEEDEIILKNTKLIKKIKVKLSNTGEETIPDETTYEFNVEKYPAISPTILKTSKAVNETIAQHEAVQLSTNIKDVPEKAQISLITRSVAESIVTKDEEKEESRQETTKIKKHKANSTIEFNESLSTDHPDTQSPLEDIVKTFDFIPGVAIKNVIPKESIIISEIHPDHTIGKETEYKKQTKEAKVTIIAHSQKVVTEFIVSTKESEIIQEVMPQKKKATQDYVEHESINVVEVNEAHTESQLLDVHKPTPVKPSIEYPINEQLIISESHSEIQPENYYPEIIVPTEVGKQLIVPSNNAITTFQIETSEKESKYNQLKHPIEYNADISIIPEKYIVISKSNIQETETQLVTQKTPEKSFANTDIILQSSIIVNSINQQENEEGFNSHLPQSHTAILTLNNANKVCSSSIIEMNEAESDLEIPVIPEMKHIETSVSGLEVLDVTEVITNESESNFTSELALELLPGTSFTENNSCIVTETTADDFSTNLFTNLNYNIYEAKLNFEELEAKQISQTYVQENDIILDETSKPTSIKPETSFSPIQSITVEQTVVTEQEQSLVLKVKPELHNSIIVPTHARRAVVIEEITPENNVTKLEKTEDNKKIALINFVDEQCIVVKEVSSYDSESNLLLDCKPENVQAMPVFSGHDVAETIEIISNDAVEQLYIQKYKNNNATLQHVPHEALMSEITSVNELEDILLNKEKKQPTTVNVTIDEVIGVNIIEQPIFEKETMSIERTVFQSTKAKTEFVPIEIADRSEIITGDYTLDLIQPEVSKFQAYHQPSTFESIILCETNISEKEQVMTDEKIPLPCSAYESMTVDEAIEITEIISDNKPEEMYISVAPKKEMAQTNIIPFKPLEGQDVMICENVESVKDKSLITHIAHISQTPFHGIETSLIVSAESENKMSEFLMPSSKKAETSYGELDIPITVVEILTQDKELDFKSNEIPINTLDRQEIILEECHVTSETMVCSSTSEFDELIPQSVYALSSKSTQMAIESLETSPFEKEMDLVNDQILSERRADFTYEEAKGIQITEQVMLDTKNELVVDKLKIERKSNITITGQDVAETLETNVESPIEEFKIEFPKEQSAKTIQKNEVHGVLVSEIVAQETESFLEDDKKNNRKIVNISVEDNSGSYMVTEIFSKENEIQLLEHSKPTYHHAEQDILSHEGLQVNETNISICENKLSDFEYSTKLGNQVIEPLECIEISEVNVQEPECNLIQSVHPKLKHATHILKENVGLIINSTEINDKENELKIDKLNTKIATEVSNLIDYKVPQKFEKTTLESVEPFYDIKEKSQQAVSEHMLLEGIRTTQVDLQDNEMPFVESAKLTEISASLEYEMEQTLDITEVCLGESESDLIPISLPRSHIAVSDMSETQQVASSFEVVSQNSTHNLNVQALPSVISIIPQSSETHSFEVTETLYQETEIPFKSVKDVLKTCSFTIQADQNIEVTEIVTNESEKTLDVGEIYKGTEANIVFNENQTVTIEEIETSDDITPLTENLLKPSNARKQLEPLLGVSVTEVRPEESEISHETPIQPISKRVTQILPENQSLTITSTIVVEKENILNKKIPEIQQNAMVTLINSPLKVVQLEENIIQMSLNDLKTTTPNEIFIESSQIPFGSINQLEINPLEKESTLKMAISKKEEVANINIDAIHILNTTEVVTGDKESIYIPLTKPDIKQASVIITDGQPVSKVYEVKPEDSASELSIPNIITCIGIPAQEVVHGLVVDNHMSHDKEQIFEGQFKASHSTAKINIENEKETKTVSEIITHEMEGQLMNLEVPSAKKAQIEITSGQEIAEKSEIVSNNALGLLEEFATKSSTAIPVQDTFESIQSAITITEDKEKPFDSNLVYEKSRVNIKIEESNSVNVIEVIVEDKEEKYISPVFPKMKTAGKSILTKEAAETSIVLADENLRKFDKFKIKEELANIIHETHSNISQSETTVHESEIYLEPVEILSNKAELTMIPNKSLSIIEVITDDNDDKLHIKQEQKSHKAITSLSTSHEVPQVTEIISSITTSDVFIPVINTDHALVLQSDLYDAAISTEINALEKEKNFIQKPNSEIFKAEIKFNEDKPLNVSEIVFDEDEIPLTLNKPIEKQALLTQSTFDVVTISEQTLIDTENNLKPTIKPEKQVINITFENNLNVQVSEVNIVDTESDLKTPIQKTETATISDLIPQPVANVTEIITSMNVKDIPKLNKFEYSKASAIHSTFKSVLQTEFDVSESEGILENTTNIERKASVKTETLENIIIIQPEVSEREGNLEELEKFDFRNAQLSIEENKSSVIVSNVKSEDKETDFTVGVNRISSVAKVTSDNFEAITQCEQNVSEKEGNLNLEIPKDETANITFQEAQTGIIVSDIVPELKEENMEIRNTTYSTATFMTENFEGLIQNERTVNEKEQLISSEPKPEITNAIVSIEKSKIGAVVSEIISNEKENNFNKTQIRKTSNATISTEEFKPLVTTEQQHISNVAELKLPEIVPDKNAKIIIDENKHLIIQESVSHEKESKIEQENPTQYNISPIFIESLSLETKQIEAETQPTLTKTKKYTEYIATKSEPEHKISIKVNENVIFESATELIQEATDKQEASITDITLSTGKKIYRLSLIINNGEYKNR